VCRKLMFFLILFLCNVSYVYGGYCGDNICQIDNGETQDNCCLDCGCPFYHKCINNVCQETAEDVGAGSGEDVGNFFKQLALPLGAFTLIVGIVIILITNILGGIREVNRR